MKHYCVTYYDGKGERVMYYVQAKSINAAKAAAKERLRKNKVIGATIVGAERYKHDETFNVLLRFGYSVEEFDAAVRGWKNRERRRLYRQPIKDPKTIEAMTKRRK